jgi:hypothetical protein
MMFSEKSTRCMSSKQITCGSPERSTLGMKVSQKKAVRLKNEPCYCRFLRLMYHIRSNIFKNFPSHKESDRKVIQRFVHSFKGQLISRCPYEKSVSSKIPTKIFLEFCPEIFCSFLKGFLGT